MPRSIPDTTGCGYERLLARGLTSGQQRTKHPVQHHAALGRCSHAIVRNLDQAVIGQFGNRRFGQIFARDAVRHLQATLLERGFSVVALSGELTQNERTQALQALRGALAAVACGGNWADRWLRGMDGDTQVFAGLRAELRASPGYGAAMERTAWPWSTDSNSVIQEFTRVSGVYRVEDDSDRCLDALLLAFEPQSLRWGEGDEDVDRAARLIANRPLARGAFLAALSSELATHGAVHG